ncbi:MAG: adenylate/guanylate cyclase domain-containing protein [Acidimicrobiales bacterium]
MTSSQPSGTVTFVFTDIEGSTRLWEQYPTEMNSALARHDVIIRGSIDAHGGWVFSTAGDGFGIAFADAHSAAEAAILAQAGLVAEEWPDGCAISVRIGIHSGPASIRNDDYFGTSVNRAARLMSVAHGGQIVISGTSASLIRSGVGLRSLGEHRLRDLREPVEVLQILHDGLQTEFPPLQSVDTFPGNLPAQLTSFVGRTAELELICDAVLTQRLVTLTGVGGVGKTRLAVQVAAEAVPEFRGGAWIVELAPVRDWPGVVNTVASALGVTDHQGLTVEEAIVAVLSARRTLLVLDNCEHLLGFLADWVEELLSECAQLSVLTTSREGLAVPGERIVAVPALSLPNESGTESTEATQLFVDRAMLVNPDFSVDGHTEADVAELCRSLDGVPLAIELAAARVQSMTPAEMLERLDERFRLLTGGRRGSRNRHQTLRRTVDWSYDLLDEDERSILARLSVFAGGFDLEGAEAVAGPGYSPIEVDDLIHSLVGKSLVVAESEAGRSRFRQLETIRQYAEERLVETGEADAVRRLHAEHYLERARAFAAGIGGPEERTWVALFNLDTANLRAAVDWAIDLEEIELAMGMLAPFVRVVFSPIEPLPMWAADVLELPGTRNHPLETDVACLAVYYGMRTNRNTVDEYIPRAIPNDDSLTPTSSAYNMIAMWEGTYGELDRAVELADKSLEAAREDNDPHELVKCLVGVATWRGLQTGADATELMGEAKQVAEEYGNPTLSAIASWGYAQAIRSTDPVRAAEEFSRAEAIAAEGGSVWLQAVSANGAIMSLSESGQLLQAAEAIDRQFQLLQDSPQLGVAVLDTAIVCALTPLAAAERYEVAAQLIGYMEENGLLTTGMIAFSGDALDATEKEVGVGRFEELKQEGAVLTGDEAANLSRQSLSEAVDTHSATWSRSP